MAAPKKAERERHLLDLIRRMPAGDQPALAEFYDLTKRQVFSLINTILRDEAAAEEVTLDVYLQIWRQAGNYDLGRGTPTTWLLLIARSRAIDYYRSRRTARTSEAPLDTVFHLSHDTTDPENRSIEFEQRRIVQRALDQLPPEQRRVIELTYFHGMTNTEIAAHLTVPLGTVKTRIRLALQSLRRVLGPSADEPVGE